MSIGCLIDINAGATTSLSPTATAATIDAMLASAVAAAMPIREFLLLNFSPNSPVGPRGQR